MSLIVVDGALTTLCDLLRSAYNLGSYKLRLFQNNVTPAQANTLATYTEATFAGYSAINLSSWGASVLAAPKATTTHPAQTFTRSSTGTGQTIYGYYITDSTGITLFWAERDPAAPITLTNAGDTYSVIPKFSFRSEF